MFRRASYSLGKVGLCSGVNNEADSLLRRMSETPENAPVLYQFLRRRWNPFLHEPLLLVAFGRLAMNLTKSSRKIMKRFPANFAGKISS